MISSNSVHDNIANNAANIAYKTLKRLRQNDRRLSNKLPDSFVDLLTEP